MPEIIVAVIALGIGLVLLLYGYRVFEALLPVWGFITGFWLGGDIVAQVLGTGFLGTIAGWAAGFFVGSLAAALSHFFHQLSIVLVGAVIGYAVGSGVLTALGLGPGLFSILAGVVAALVVGGLFYVLGARHIFVMATTAFGGANAVLLAVLLLIGQISLASLEANGNPVEPVLRSSWFWLIAWLAMAFGGYLFQERLHRSHAFAHEGESIEESQ